MGCTISIQSLSFLPRDQDVLDTVNKPRKTLHRNTCELSEDGDDNNASAAPHRLLSTLEDLPHLIGHPSSALNGYALGCEVSSSSPLVKLFVGLAKLTYESKMLKVYTRNLPSTKTSTGPTGPSTGPNTADITQNMLSEQVRWEQLIIQEVDVLHRLQETSSGKTASTTSAVALEKCFLALEDIYLSKDEVFLVMSYCNVITLENYCRIQQQSLQSSRRSSTNSVKNGCILESKNTQDDDNNINNSNDDNMTLQDITIHREDSTISVQERLLNSQKGPYLKDEDIFTIFSQVVDMVLHSHQRGIVLRNLCAKNFSVVQTLPTSAATTASTFDIKVVDVSMAIDVDYQFKWNHDHIPHVQDHLLYSYKEDDLKHYLAPELVAKQTKGSFASDVWALGVLLHHMYTGCYSHAPHCPDVNVEEVIPSHEGDASVESRIQLPTSSQESNEVKPNIPIAVQCLIYQMLCYHPENRITINDLAKKAKQLRDGFRNPVNCGQKWGSKSFYSSKTK